MKNNEKRKSMLNRDVQAHFGMYKALRVLPAETRATVYRRPRVTNLFFGGRK